MIAIPSRSPGGSGGGTSISVRGGRSISHTRSPRRRQDCGSGTGSRSIGRRPAGLEASFETMVIEAFGMDEVYGPA